MNYFAFKLLVFLLLGAIINVAVAWGFSLGSQPLPHDYQTVALDWQFEVPPEYAEKPAAAYRRRTYGLTHFGAISTVRNDGTWDIEEAVLAGFPVRSIGMQSTRQGFYGRPKDHEYWNWTGSRTTGFKLPKAYGDSAAGFRSRHLPLRPLWPGFAINTIFYAAIVWMLLAVPGYLMRRRRIKRGECVRCAYPVGTNDKCTECGNQI